ncbi:hypothetical protein [Bacillus solitudinis]|uniref:hypothetical protein n=1 Tax=Bacillus solitudinis TaxID=2014074 RepID=UPI000C24E771|nr:hypothetical protein [Bacillus solitudinis]
MNKLDRIIERLQKRNPIPLLCPNGIWDLELTKEIEDLSEQQLETNEKTPFVLPQAATSGLLLWNDDLVKSHNISQDLSNEIGSFWHGLMHRREGDFSNAKYWYSKVGDHPVYDSLYEKAWQLSEVVRPWEKWDPYQFIDAVEHVVANGLEETGEGEQLRQIQILEMNLFLQYSLSTKTFVR